MKVDGNKQKLRGIALTDFIKQRLAKSAGLQETADDTRRDSPNSEREAHSSAYPNR